MMNASKLFDAAARERVHRRIAALEERTGAEVVCGVATESGRYDRAESIVGLIFGLLALTLGSWLIPAGGWNMTAVPPLGWQAALVVAGFVIGSLLASYWHPLRWLLVLQREMNAEVNRRSHQVFSQHGVGGTRHRGGLLIYLSLFEHRLEIRCDKAVADALSEGDLDTIRDAVINEVRHGRFTEGLIAGLDRADELLAKALPGEGEDTSALPNELLLFHPRP